MNEVKNNKRTIMCEAIGRWGQVTVNVLWVGGDCVTYMPIRIVYEGKHIA